jgi:beta-phosphoglucomutase
VLRAIVFDFDGVIANSEPLHCEAFQDVLAGVGVDLSRPDYYARYLGFDDVGVFKAVLEDRGLQAPAGRIAELVAAKAQRLEQLEEGRSILFPGAAAAIRRLHDELPLAIASGALGAEIRRVLGREQLTACFRTIVSAEDTPRGKPAADPYLRAVALLNGHLASPVVPADCAAVEDSPWGLQSARAAGLRTVAITHTYGRDALDAEIVISSLDELRLDQLQQRFGV